MPIYKGENNMSAKVVSGEVFGVKGPITARTPTYYIDFIFEKENTSYTHVIPKGWNSMLVMYQGSIVGICAPELDPSEAVPRERSGGPEDHSKRIRPGNLPTPLARGSR